MAILCLLLSAVCLSDYRNARIPNRMMLIILFYGMGYRYWDAGGSGLLEYVSTCFFMFLLLFPLFIIGVIGAGDVKLYSVTSGYLSGQVLSCFLIISLLLSAVFSIIKLIREGFGRERLLYLCSYLAEVSRCRCWREYFRDASDARRAGIPLAGPVFLSLLLHVGGVY